MRVTKALKLIKRSHIAKRAKELFDMKYPPLIVGPEQYKYLKEMDERAKK